MTKTSQCGGATEFAASMLFAGALLMPFSVLAQAPSLPASSKADLAAPPAPVTAPLSIGTAFNALLSDSLDTHKAKPGDVVIAETAEDVTYERSVIFPKGTKIVGHIVRANSGGHGRTGSALFVQFDKAIMKDGQEVLLNAGIQALAVNAVAPSQDVAKESALPEPPETNAAVPEGVAADASSESGGTVVSTIYDVSPRGLRPPLFAETAAQGEINSDGLFTPDSKGAFGRPDLKVYTPTSEGSHGTVLLSAKKHMHLEGGTHLLLVVQPPPTPGQNASDLPDASQQDPNP